MLIINYLAMRMKVMNVKYVIIWIFCPGDDSQINFPDVMRGKHS